MGRSPIPPKVRWQVFARDGFRCRYCGSQPPDVALVVDHARPVARGGINTLDNLITACEPCNQGKSDARITAISELRARSEALDSVMSWVESDWFAGSHANFALDEPTYLYLITNAPSYGILDRVLLSVGKKFRLEEIHNEEPRDICDLLCRYLDYINGILADYEAQELALTSERVAEAVDRFWREHHE